jgi:hypothetical protein
MAKVVLKSESQSTKVIRRGESQSGLTVQSGTSLRMRRLLIRFGNKLASLNT